MPESTQPASADFQQANELTNNYFAEAGGYDEESFDALMQKVDETFEQSPDHIDTAEVSPTEGRVQLVWRKAQEAVIGLGLHLRGLEPRDIMRGGLATVGGTMAVVSLAACTTNGGGQETETPGENLSTQEKIEAALAARPEPGTPEYEQLFQQYAVPYVEGQPAAEVLAAFDAAIDNWAKSGYSDGPQNREELKDWATSPEGGSLNDLGELLELDYYDTGIGNELLGEGWQDTAFGQEIVLTDIDNPEEGNPGIAGIHRNRVLGMINGDVPKSATIETTSVAVSLDLPTEIRGTTTATIGGVAEGKNGQFGGSYHLQAVDTDGDNVPDQWNYVGRAS